MFVRVGFGTNTTALNAGGSFGRFGQEMAPSGCSFTERLLLLAVFSHCRFSFCNHSATDQLHPLGVCG